MATKTPRIAVECAGETWCPVTATASILGRKWHPVIVDRLLHRGELGFNDLKREVDGITSKVLSESLEDLEQKGLVDREIVSEKPVRVAYSLTDVGQELEEIIGAMKTWGEAHLMPPEHTDASLR